LEEKKKGSWRNILSFTFNIHFIFNRLDQATYFHYSLHFSKLFLPLYNKQASLPAKPISPLRAGISHHSYHCLISSAKIMAHVGKQTA